MRITVNTFGTRGDIQPYIALSLGLRQAGHVVRIVTHRIFAPFVQEHSLELHPLDLDPPEKELLDFLQDGPPPVYVGFGSMVDHERTSTNRLIIDALQGVGVRGILQAGWSDLGAGDMPDSVLRVGAVPHDWLFPQMAAVVHHGGAGTTAAALRAGIPNVVVPWFGDQFFWGWRVQELGAGPAPINRSRLTAAELAAAIGQALTHETIRNTAAQLGEQIRSEDGIGTAVRLIEAFTGGAQNGPIGSDSAGRL